MFRKHCSASSAILHGLPVAKNPARHLNLQFHDAFFFSPPTNRNGSRKKCVSNVLTNLRCFLPPSDFVFLFYDWRTPLHFVVRSKCVSFSVNNSPLIFSHFSNIFLQFSCDLFEWFFKFNKVPPVGLDRGTNRSTL